LAYIGTIPAEAYTSFAVQHFTTSATDTFTLDFPVANENEIALFINNVRQEPGSSYAYTASGTTLTLSSAITGSDSMYCVFIGKAVQTVTPAVGSVTNDMLASGSFSNITGTGTLTNFTSTGIDDNASANALTIDSSSNLKFNSGYGSVATAYGCRAWVNFNGTGTVAIRGSGNVSSITDNGTGDYTVNFTTNMPDVNYFIGDGPVPIGSASASLQRTTYLVGSVRVRTRYATVADYDWSDVFISVFR